MTLSLRSRLLVILAGLLALGLGLAAVVTVTAVRRDMISRIDETLRSVSHNPPPPVPMEPNQGTVGQGAVGGPPVGDTPLGSATGGDSGRSVAVVIFGRDGRAELSLPSGYGSDPDPLPDLPGDPREIATGVFLEAEPSRDPGPVYRALASRLPDGRIVVAAAPLSDVDAAVRTLALVWLVTGIALLAVLVAAGWWAIRAGMRPIDDMVETAGTIAAGDLTQRVDHTDPRSEVGRLGSAINVMLGRIQEAFVARVESEERLRRFVADASHELRTPVTVVSGYAELYRTGALDTEEKRDGALARIESESHRMGGLVEDLLLLARLDQGRPLRSENVDLEGICGAAVRDFESTVGRTIAFESVGPVVVTGDPERLYQVIANLLGNVAAHTPEESAGTLRIGRSGEFVEVTVVDDGPGMDPALAAHVFERFWRADPGRTRKTGGTGLGLAIVRSIVSAHGGEVGVSTSAGAGFAVTLRLPVTPGISP